MTNTEVNIRIAEKVFGRKVTIELDWPNQYYVEDPEGFRLVGYPSDKGFDYLRKYCTDLNIAFLVIEKLREKRIAMSVGQVYHTSNKNWEYMAKADIPGVNDPIFELHTSAAMAICLCALAVSESISISVGEKHDTT